MKVPDKLLELVEEAEGAKAQGLTKFNGSDYSTPLMSRSEAARRAPSLATTPLAAASLAASPLPAASLATAAHTAAAIASAVFAAFTAAPFAAATQPHSPVAPEEKMSEVSQWAGSASPAAPVTVLAKLKAC